MNFGKNQTFFVFFFVFFSHSNHTEQFLPGTVRSYSGWTFDYQFYAYWLKMDEKSEMLVGIAWNFLKKKIEYDGKVLNAGAGD